ncbi:hypothetical protein [Denitrobaculum tricleocarpae]|uniref:hypothetical protein n=1 Tax=Denitrobaculum tricleocarpae TaxID=2591009 RepID=UPI0015D15447|nr:hypothetical protein [Denitrobaculum tricleocarpae]
MSNSEPEADFEFAAAGSSGGGYKRSWRAIVTSIVTIATGTVAVGLGLLYLLVSAPH